MFQIRTCLFSLELVLYLLHPRSLDIGHDLVRRDLLRPDVALFIGIADSISVDDTVERELWPTEP